MGVWGAEPPRKRSEPHSANHPPPPKESTRVASRPVSPPPEPPSANVYEPPQADLIPAEEQEKAVHLRRRALRDCGVAFAALAGLFCLLFPICLSGGATGVVRALGLYLALLAALFALPSAALLSRSTAGYRLALPLALPLALLAPILGTFLVAYLAYLYYSGPGPAARRRD